MINHHISKALSLLDFHQNQVDMYKDVFEWSEEDKFNEMFSEDETDYNNNVRKEENMDEDFLTYCRKEIEYHSHELERAKVRLNICMLTFNNGWTF